jgi:hypothetical protein
MADLTLSDIGGYFLVFFGAIGTLLVWLQGRQQTRRQNARIAPGGHRRTMWGVGATRSRNAPQDENRKTQRDMVIKL